MAPIVQLLVLGYAATTDVKDIPIVIVDADRSAASRELVQRFATSQNFKIVGMPGSTSDIDPYLDGGVAWMAISIPPDYGQRIATNRQTALQIVADGTDANSTGVAMGYAQLLITGYIQDLLGGAAPSGAPAGPLVRPEVRVWFNPRLESREFMVPGIVALLLLVITTNLSAMAIVREKEIGTLEQLNVTPLARWELITGKMIPYAAIGLIDVVLVLIVALYWFEIPMRGSLPLLFGMCLIYLLTTLGLGLFVSTISSTQQQAMMTSIFFFLLPMLYLSGFIFPIENMPQWIQLLTYLLPLRYFLEIVRGIFVKGIGLEILWPQAVALFAWGAAMLMLATLRSSKRLA
jgi:ABC-2 type transport system permease protein